MSDLKQNEAQIKVGDVVRFGAYPQDEKGEKKAPIEWLVLEKNGDVVIMVSRYALDCLPYDTTGASITWDRSTLRSWLNDAFLSAAFTKDEREAIPELTVSADENPHFTTQAGRAVSDRIFLLGLSEAERYFPSDYTRRCGATAYAISRGAEHVTFNRAGGKDVCYWWLRTPGDVRNHAAFVEGNGNVWFAGCLTDMDYLAVRPALRIDLSVAAEKGVGPTVVNNDCERPALPSLDEVGKTVFFGAYPQGKDGVQKTPIEWLVLEKEDDRILVVSRRGLDLLPFHKEAIPTRWETSSVREWLNREFSNAAFTPEEQALIPTVRMKAEHGLPASDAPERDTTDKVFLLSYAEASCLFPSDEERKCVPTEYLASLMELDDANEASWWWLRSSSADDDQDVFAVDEHGTIREERASNLLDAVRPALWIRLK